MKQCPSIKAPKLPHNISPSSPSIPFASFRIGHPAWGLTKWRWACGSCININSVKSVEYVFSLLHCYHTSSMLHDFPLPPVCYLRLVMCPRFIHPMFLGLHTLGENAHASAGQRSMAHLVMWATYCNITRKGPANPCWPPMCKKCQQDRIVVTAPYISIEIARRCDK